MENIFHITYTIYVTGRGFMAGGLIEKGIFHVGDQVRILRENEFVTDAAIAGIEMLNFGSRNSNRRDNVAFLLKDFGDIEIRSGDYIHTKA